MSTNRNRYSTARQIRPPRKNHAKRMPGDLEDSGKWYHCRICGFPCNIEREKLMDGDGHVNATFTEQVPGEVNFLCESGEKLETEDGYDLIVFEELVDIIRYYPTTNGGCPLCGSLNWL